MRPEFDRLDLYLTQWAAWMRRPDIDTGFPEQASPFQARARIQHFDDLADECDCRAVEIMDALIRNLEDPENNSVHLYHLGSSWRFPGYMPERCYETARGNLDMWIRDTELA
jgi:hypothetical protein